MTSKLHSFAKTGKVPQLSSINICFPCCNELYFSTACSQILKDQLILTKAKKVCYAEGKDQEEEKISGNFQKLQSFLKPTKILRILLE